MPSDICIKRLTVISNIIDVHVRVQIIFILIAMCKCLEHRTPLDKEQIEEIIQVIRSNQMYVLLGFILILLTSLALTALVVVVVRCLRKKSTSTVQESSSPQTEQDVVYSSTSTLRKHLSPPVKQDAVYCIAIQDQVGKQQLQVRDGNCDVPVLKNHFGGSVGETRDHCSTSIGKFFFRYITKHTKSTQTKALSSWKIQCSQGMENGCGHPTCPLIQTNPHENEEDATNEHIYESIQ